MNEETVLCESLPRPKRAERVAMDEASDLLKRPGHFSLLVQTLLFCVLLLFAWITATQLLTIPLSYAVDHMDSFVGMLILEGLYYLVAGILLFVMVMPAWLGRLRVAGRMCTGDTPAVREVLYYFTTPTRYRRALLLSLLLAVQVLLSVLLCSLAFLFSFELYFQVIYFDFSPTVGVLLLIALLLAATAISIGVLLLTGFFQMTAAIAIGNEEMTVFGALRLALRRGAHRLPTLFRFSLRSLWRLLLSLVTFGVLFVFWYAHHYMLSYMRLSMALCPKGEN